MDTDTLNGRRKRIGKPPKKTAQAPPGTPTWGDMWDAPQPGTPEFGERAAERLEGMRQRDTAGDLRVQTAYKTVKQKTAARKKLLQTTGEY